ncbi:MAG: type VI secretion system baseplate subunit TssG [Gammaproteobacteria bacterium]|nr:type VI secretion system baseplate subunit TssG [Gammaproteobacteria bacterium]
MAGKGRNKNLDLELLAILTQEPYRFGFFEALRQLECLYADRPRLGQSMRPADDAIRLGQTPSMQFAPSTLSAFELSTLKPLNLEGENADPGNTGLVNTDPEHASPARLSVYFFGLFGPNGPLPLHLTEFARNRVRNARDSALVDFTDLFHHRLLSLFYRAWANKEPTVQLDRPQQDRFSLYVGSLLGLGEHSLQQRDAMPDHTKLHFAAHLGCHTRHAEGMKSILSEFLKVPVNIKEFVGEWLEIPDDSYCYLNQDSTGRLGQSAVIGTRSWQCQHKFRIEIGPVDLHEYRRLLPGSNSLKALVDIVKNYTGLEFNWDINLILSKQDVPPARLGEYGQLGLTSWLENKNRKSDANDLYLYMENIA